MEWDVNDPDQRRYLQAARAWGVSPSRFMGREPLVTSEVFGGITVHTVKPEWSKEDREAAVALQDYEASLCSGCGQPFAETSDPDMEFGYRHLLPLRCHYCTESSRGQAAYEESEHAHALHFPVVKKSDQPSEGS